MQGLLSEEFTFLLIGSLLLHKVVGREKESAGTAGRVGNSFANLRTRHIDHGLDE